MLFTNLLVGIYVDSLRDVSQRVFTTRKLIYNALENDNRSLLTLPVKTFPTVVSTLVVSVPPRTTPPTHWTHANWAEWPAAEYVMSRRANPLLVVDDFLYRKNGQPGKSGQQYWVCITRGCNARITTVYDHVAMVPPLHSHEPCPDHVEKLKIAGAAKLAALSSNIDFPDDDDENQYRR
ncbi:uncharacterized protein LOC111260424 isoform X1 [Varroa jacobsoni]|uniref:uncharacterized protein LOC111260424 isoform X1 n=1 Tax=Varroa jacobsoni TaxID=62625 RepID=UPI000BF8AE7A|nr:uncharacterized protein LOC111260424 isoform X1 [Varroa jacobsoni]